MQAILTKYLGPTDTKGARISARCDAGSIMIPYPHELSGYDVHAAAAMALVRKLEWRDYGKWSGGSLPDQKGFVFVLTQDTWQYDAAFRGAP
jgi:hypothetical protein